MQKDAKKNSICYFSHWQRQQAVCLEDALKKTGAGQFILRFVVRKVQKLQIEVWVAPQ